MASACVTAAAGDWLGPRASFSLEDSSSPPIAAFDPSSSSSSSSPVHGAAAGSPSSPDFEFQPAISAAALHAADELFSGGKLVPLIPLPEPLPLSPPSSPPPSMASPAPEEEPAASVTVGPSRWRKLLRLKKKNQPRPAKSGDLAALKQPLLPNATQDPDDAAAVAPRKIRLSKQSVSPPPPSSSPATATATATGTQTAAQTPLTVAADSPRLTAAGKVVYQGLGRSSSSPSSLAGGGGGRTSSSARSGGGQQRAGGIERSYSAHVRVAPVLHVPVCSLRGGRRSSVSVFGIEKLFSSSSAAAAKSSSSAAAAAPAKGSKSDPPQQKG